MNFFLKLMSVCTWKQYFIGAPKDEMNHFFWILHRKPLARFCTNFAYYTVLLFPDSCPICLDILENPRTLKCKHAFCTKCLKKALAVNYKCPVCYEPQGVVQGNQPPGEMKTRFDSSQAVPGYEGIFMLCLSKLPSSMFLCTKLSSWSEFSQLPCSDLVTPEWNRGAWRHN